MKREMDLVREILLVIEAQEPRVSGISEVPTIGEWDPLIVYGHVLLLRDAGFLQRTDMLVGNPPKVFVSDLSWEGHEFLDAIRNTTVWERLKRKVLEEGGAIPLTLLKSLAIKLAADRLGLPSP
jgi:hypothetical protein